MAFLTSQFRNPTIGGVLLVATVLMSTLGSSVTFAITLSVALLVALPFAFYLVSYALAKQKILAAVDRHMAELVERRARLRAPDAHGAVQTEKWNEEIEYFFDTEISGALSGCEHLAVRKKWSGIVGLIESQMDLAVGAPAVGTPVRIPAAEKSAAPPSRDPRPRNIGYAASGPARPSFGRRR